MSTLTQPTPHLGTARWLPILLAGVAAAASLVAVGGGTDARSVVAIALPLAAGTWIRRAGHGRHPAATLAMLGLLGAAGSLHATLTSPTAAWLVDSHMVPAGLLPGGTARIAVAWAVPVLWAAVFVAMAVTHRRVAGPVGSVVLLGVGVAPLLFGNSFPTDAYRLLWDSTALGHPVYAVGAWTVLVVTMLHHYRDSWTHT